MSFTPVDTPPTDPASGFPGASSHVETANPLPLVGPPADSESHNSGDISRYLGGNS